MLEPEFSIFSFNLELRQILYTHNLYIYIIYYCGELYSHRQRTAGILPSLYIPGLLVCLQQQYGIATNPKAGFFT